jgi:hypothetical protein
MIEKMYESTSDVRFARIPDENSAVYHEQIEQDL